MPDAIQLARQLEDFHRLKIFHKNDVTALTKDKKAAKEIIRRYRKQGLIAQVRRDLYVVTDLANKVSLATQKGRDELLEMAIHLINEDSFIPDPLP